MIYHHQAEDSGAAGGCAYTHSAPPRSPLHIFGGLKHGRALVASRWL
jgi:hypothetical protein